MNVHKRNGVIEEFDINQICKSLESAFIESNLDPKDIPLKLALEVQPEILKIGAQASSTQIGDIVGKAIMKEGLFEVLRSYVLRSYML